MTLEITDATRVVIEGTLIGPGTQVHSAVADADVVIAAGALVVATDAYQNAIVLEGAGSGIEVQGFVSAGQFGVSLWANEGGNRLHVTATGDIYGGECGAWVSGASEVVNEGSIRGGFNGVQLAFDSGPVSLRNEGVIVGTASGVLLFSDLEEGDSVRIENTGRIEGNAAVFVYGTGRGTVHVVNQGLLDGDVFLGAGDDIFDNRAGQWVGERIDGSFGSDVYMPGAGTEVIREWEMPDDIDTLDFSGSAGLRVSLADGSGSGWAAGDTYEGIERVVGSEAGADTLIGDGLANILEGRGGRDALEGGEGADRLTGGLGIDRLTGGGGDDAFVFGSLQERGDVIADFGGALGNGDRIEIDASAFGGGLVEGAVQQSQFVVSNRNAARDADDRFLFRTTDATLWFDADGRGKAKAVMIADLQAGAALEFTDLLLV